MKFSTACRCLAVAIFGLIIEIAGATPQITEFVAINRSSLIDGDGNTPDWIEIHNPDSLPIDLAGYHLTDDAEIPNKYTFPAGTTLAAGGYLVVFASGRSEPNYVDAGGNLHTTFSISGDGEYLALNAPDSSVIQAFAPAFPPQFADISYGAGTEFTITPLVVEEAPARWLVPASDIGTGWRSIAFDDTSWTASETGIGYGYDGGLIGANGDTRNSMWTVNASVYLRVPFEVNDPAEVGALTLNMRFDDGFVAYLNGTRIASANAPSEASLEFDSNATEAHPNAVASEAIAFPVSSGSLVPGTNVLAIHGLNLSASGAGSSDFLALPELEGTSNIASNIFGHFTEPSPGDENLSRPVEGFVADTKFSRDRGYYNTAFELAITSETPEATIIYTTDGTPPSDTNGQIYTSPISISSTSTIRAFATRPNYQPTNIDTQTYLFVDDIVRQTRPPSYPDTIGRRPADYDMDPDIVDDPDYANDFDAAFSVFPSLSLVFDPDALFDETSGIYQNPAREGREWERPLSVELIVPDGSEPGFQINAGVRVQGGSSRSTDTPKHSLSLRFRAEYGSGKLRYPLFRNTIQGDTAIESFDLLQLRPEYNFGWMHRHWYQAENALYGRDQWASDLFNSMGQQGSHGRWTHLFFNGLYWGLYDLHERPDADFMASYFGGSDDDYDTVNSSVATNGDLVAFNEMMDLAYGNIETAATYEAIQEFLNIDQFIDYMLLNAYVGNRDWDGHNWRAARKREPGAGYQFFPWDTETGAAHVGGGVFDPPPEFFSTALATNVTGKRGNRRPTGLQSQLQRNPEYRLRYADHVRAHMFNGGALTPEFSSGVWTTRSDKMRIAIVAESARWGDFRRDVLPGRRWNSEDYDLYTRDDHYLPLHDWLVDTYLVQRTDIVLDQLREIDLYPEIDAPDFSQYGGATPRGFELEMTAPATVYFTTDGSDPRLTGGNINPSASSGTVLTLNESTQVKARARSAGGEWSALSEAFFSISQSELKFSEVMYKPRDQPLAEFIEIYNSGSFDVSLAGLTFSEGIDFDFDEDSSIASLAPNARLLIVRNLIAFRAVYGNAHDEIIAGSFQNETALSDEGETVTLLDGNGEVVQTLTYNDKSPWPIEADGDGRSLIFAGDDPALPRNWRPSAALNGNPGTTDTTSYDGGSLLGYALSGPLTILNSSSPTTFTYVVNLTADDALIGVQYSSDLNSWETVSSVILSQQLGPEGNTRMITQEFPPGTIGFARIVVSRPGG